MLYARRVDRCRDGVVEYHVHLRMTFQDVSEYILAYDDFWGQVLESVRRAPEVVSSDVDMTCTGRQYVWFHLNDDPSYEKRSKEILRRLNDEYPDTVQIPSLLLLACRVLDGRRAFARSIVEHQARHGQHGVEGALHIYFQVRPVECE